ncbi:MAG: hypothetical protein LBF38_04040 [Deltaproteobacteria bacterium]|jgi:hypothetical protein|nr:hypothetical protein [Deltaproteobacteria bacterium]
MKNLLFLISLIFFFGQALAFGQPPIDQDRYSFDAYDINAPISGDSDEEEFEFDGFTSFGGEEDNFRLDDFQLPNAYAPNLPNVSAEALSLTLKSKQCDLTAYVSVTYPVNLGSPELDDYVKSIFIDIYESAIAQSLAMMDEKLEGQETCPEDLSDIMIFQSSFKVLSASPEVISLVMYGNFLTGLNRPENLVKAININTKELRNIDSSDIFPQGETSYQKLWAYLANSYCKMEQGGSTLPVLYDRADCPKDGFGPASPLPENWTDPTTDFDDMGGNVYLTPEGLRVDLSSYESWGYVTGPAEILIPKDELQKMGASMAFWP